MIIYLAGQGSGMRRAHRNDLYQHVLFSHYHYLKKNYAWMKRRKQKEKVRERQSKTVSGSAQ